MTKRILLVATVFSSLALTQCQSNDKGYFETEAIAALDAVTETIGNLQSCSLTVLNERTEMTGGEPADHIRESDIYLRGADKLHIYTVYDDVRKGFWYNGTELSVFNFNESVYDVTPAPNTTMAMIDSLNNRFKIDFPGADIFYPTLTDDIIANFDSVLYLGTQEVDGILCKTVNAKNANLDVTFFIDDATRLPVQLAIYGRGQRAGETYISHYQDWQVNPVLGDEIFEFAPPKNASKTAIFKKN